MKHELVDIRVKHLVKYEEIKAGFDHNEIEGEAKNPETGEMETIKVPVQTFGYWLDFVNAAIDAGWFKHLTKEQAADFTPHELFTTFRQVDDKHTELLAASFVDPNS